MKVKYEITMKVEINTDKFGEISNKHGFVEELTIRVSEGFLGRCYTRDQATVTNVKVSKTGATGITPRVVQSN